MHEEENDDLPQASPRVDAGDVWRVIKQGLLYLRPYWREHILLVITVLVSVALGICLPLGLRLLIDDAIARQNLELMVVVLGALALLLFLASLAEVIQVYVRAQFGGELKRDLRLKLFSHLQTLPMSYYDSVEPGQITALFANDVITLRNAWRNLTIRGFRAYLQLIVTLLTMALLNWRLTIVLAAILALTVKLQRAALSESEVADYSDKMADARVAFAVQDNVASFAMTRAFGLAERTIATFKEVTLNRPAGPRTINTYDWNTFLQGLRNPAFIKSMVVVSANIQQSFIYVVALCTGAWLTYNGSLTVGTYSALLALFVSLGQSISNLSAFFQDLVSAATALDRIEQVLNLQSDVKDAIDARPLPRIRGQIAFNQVSFGYRGKELQVRDLTFQLPSNGSLALVGRSGCGKSTAMKLMLRFYDPLQGSVSFDGHDIARVTLESLRGQIGVVLQELVLFNASIRDNIAVVKPGASDGEIEEAARAAEIHATIEQFPQGYKTQVGEGGKRLSLGQRQRIALARALLCDPAILILDEITSALDPESEAAIQETLHKISHERTVVLLTHRLSSVSKMDHVVVLDRGTLVQQGSHQELLTRPGLYRQFWQIQSGFVISNDGRRAEVTAQRLAEIPLFADIDGAAREQLASCFLTEYYERGEMICSEGQLADRFFIIVRGRAQVLASGRDQAEQMEVAILEDGDYFGEDAMMDGTTYTTGARVEFPTLVLYLKRSDFKKMMKSTSSVRLTMEETALGRSLTLVGRRGRRPSRIPCWDTIMEG